MTLILDFFFTNRYLNKMRHESQIYPKDRDKPRPNYLLTNPLSVKWKVSVLKYQANKNPLQLAKLPAYYVAGMLGYLVSIPVRLLGVGKDVVMLGVTLVVPGYGDGNYVSKVGVRFKVLAGSLSDPLIAFIGVFVPPLAYFLDEKLQSHSTIHAHSLTQWSHDALKSDDLFYPSVKEVIGDANEIVGVYLDALQDFMGETEILLSVFMLLNIEADPKLCQLCTRADEIFSRVKGSGSGALKKEVWLQHLALLVIEEGMGEGKDVSLLTFKEGGQNKFNTDLKAAKEALRPYYENHPEQLPQLIIDISNQGRKKFVTLNQDQALMDYIKDLKSGSPSSDSEGVVPQT